MNPECVLVRDGSRSAEIPAPHRGEVCFQNCREDLLVSWVKLRDVVYAHSPRRIRYTGPRHGDISCVVTEWRWH